MSAARNTDLIEQIMSERFHVEAPDGSVSVCATAEGRLCGAQVGHCDDDPGYLHLSSATTYTVRQALALAQERTAQRLAAMPGLNPQLRALLMGQ